MVSPTDKPVVISNDLTNKEVLSSLKEVEKWKSLPKLLKMATTLMVTDRGEVECVSIIRQGWEHFKGWFDFRDHTEKNRVELQVELLLTSIPHRTFDGKDLDKINTLSRSILKNAEISKNAEMPKSSSHYETATWKHIEFANGSLYSGNTDSENRPNGFGILINRYAEVYEGQFKNGLQDGHGVLTYTDGRLYEGKFYKGQRHGQGKMTYIDKSTYEGEFQNGFSISVEPPKEPGS